MTKALPVLPLAMEIRKTKIILKITSSFSGHHYNGPVICEVEKILKVTTSLFDHLKNGAVICKVVEIFESDWFLV